MWKLPFSEVKLPAFENSPFFLKSIRLLQGPAGAGPNKFFENTDFFKSFGEKTEEQIPLNIN